MRDLIAAPHPDHAPLPPAPLPPAPSAEPGVREVRDVPYREVPEALMPGAAPADAPERARAAGPPAHAGPGAPPFLLVHGDRDTMVAPSPGECLAAALRTAGCPVESWTVPGADQGRHGLPDAQVEEICTRPLAFARDLVPPGRPATRP